VQKEIGSSTVWVGFDALRYQAHGTVILPLLHQIAKMAPSNNEGVSKVILETLFAAATDYVKDHIPGGKYLADFSQHFRIAIDPATGLPESPATVMETCFQKLIKKLAKN